MKNLKSYILANLRWLVPVALVVSYSPALNALEGVGLMWPVILLCNAILAAGTFRTFFPRLSEMIFLVDPGANKTSDEKLMNYSSDEYNAYYLGRFSLAYVIFFSLWCMFHVVRIMTN